MFSQAELLPPVPLEFAACVFPAYLAGKNKRRDRKRGTRKKDRRKAEAPVQADVK